MSEMESLKERLGLTKRPSARLQEDHEEPEHDPRLVALTEYEEALKILVKNEELVLEEQRKLQAQLEPHQKRFQEATRKFQLSLLGKSE